MIADTSATRTQRKSKKARMLVVDDEPDNLDLLYRTFRRHFNVLRAKSGVEALELLSSEGEVAVIISDQRMPEMKGTEFLSKTVPEFPDTVRIILTGFTDVEDLVDAINAGQVYRYITKPWDPEELKGVVDRAVETYDLLKQRTEEIQRAQAQSALMETIFELSEQAASIDATLTPLAAAFSENLSANSCIFQLVKAGELTPAFGSVGSPNITAESLADNSLVQTAIAEKTPQINTNAGADEGLAVTALYQAEGIEAQAVIPVVFRGEVLAVLSLHWQEPHELLENAIALLAMPIYQVALMLTCVRSMATLAV
ncbi:MAG: response regulator [Cyanobacteria bacterium P01_C01_bin.73]